MATDSGTGVRLAYLDNLKWVLIAGVIVSHAATAYGAIGGWLYVEPTLGPLTKAIFSVLTDVADVAYRLGISRPKVYDLIALVSPTQTPVAPLCFPAGVSGPRQRMGSPVEHRVPYSRNDLDRPGRTRKNIANWV
jgi:hypothetical protein